VGPFQLDLFRSCGSPVAEEGHRDSAGADRGLQVKGRAPGLEMLCCILPSASIPFLCPTAAAPELSRAGAHLTPNRWGGDGGSVGALVML